jgi:hypothetical protein
MKALLAYLSPQMKILLARSAGPGRLDLWKLDLGELGWATVHLLEAVRLWVRLAVRLPPACRWG